MSRVNRMARQHRAGTALIVILGGVFLAGLAAQVVHMFEHAVQLGKWIVQPTMMPWMSSWGHALSDYLADMFAGGRHMPGMELAHMLANIVFVTALAIGWWLAWARMRRTTGLRRATIFQSIHLAEHVSLAVSAVVLNTPIGLTTLWGALDGTQPGAIAFRVLLHFAFNLVATMLAVDSMGEAVSFPRRRRQTVPVPAPAPASRSPQPV